MASSNKRFLFATDFSNFSDHALAHALLWAKACQAPLDCVYVIAVDRHLDIDGAVIETFLDEERKATQPKFDALVAAIQAEAGPCDGYFLTGVPDEVISKLAREIGADCIFMGTHGRRGFSRLMMGSVASSVIRRSPVPVLTVKAGQRSPEHPLRGKTSVQAAPSPGTS